MLYGEGQVQKKKKKTLLKNSHSLANLSIKGSFFIFFSGI